MRDLLTLLKEEEAKTAKLTAKNQQLKKANEDKT